MKKVSHRLKLLFLIVVIGISPISASYATVASCSKMMTEMDNANIPYNMVEDKSESDCCGQNNCASIQCVNTIAAAILSTTITTIKTKRTKLIQLYTQSVNNYYFSTIYRPPKA